MAKPQKAIMGHAAFYPNQSAPKLPLGKKAPVLEANIYRLMELAVEEGVSYGLRRADKHANDPITEVQSERLKEHISREVMNSIGEWFKFPE